MAVIRGEREIIRQDHDERESSAKFIGKILKLV